MYVCTAVYVSRVAHAPSAEVAVVFGGLGSAWLGMADVLSNIEVFRASYEECTEIAEQRKVDRLRMSTQSRFMFDTCRALFSATIAVQIASYDVMVELGLRPSYVIGHSVGECVAAYAAGMLTREEAMKVAVSLGAAADKSENGAMYAVGMNAEKLARQLPKGVSIVCFNGVCSTTIASTDMPVLTWFVNHLKDVGIKTKLIPSAKKVLHCPDATGNMRNILSCTLPFVMPASKPRNRPAKWISTVVSDPSLLSPSYFVDAMTTPVTFCRAIKRLPANTRIVELSPAAILSGLIPSIHKFSHPPIKCFSHEDSKERFIRAIAELQHEGLLQGEQDREKCLRLVL